MDRVTFLVEDSNQLIECLLNPEKLLMHRNAGISEVQSVHGKLAGVGSSNTPLLFSGGGVTETELYLLFDISLQTKPLALHEKDVRKLTLPLWELTNHNNPKSTPTIVYFIWGKSMKIRGVVLSLSERLEHFTASGIPQRSWISLRFRHIDMPQLLAKQSVTASWNKGHNTSITHVLKGGEKPEAVSPADTANVQSLATLDTTLQDALLKTGITAQAQQAIKDAESIANQLIEQLAMDVDVSSTEPAEAPATQHDEEDKEAKNTATVSIQKTAQTIQQQLQQMKGTTSVSLLEHYNKFEQTFNTLISKTQDFYQNTTTSFADKMREKSTDLLNKAKQQSQALAIVSKQVLKQLQKHVVEAVAKSATMMKSVQANLEEKINKVKQELSATIMPVYQKIKTSLNTVINSIKSIAYDTIDKLLTPLLTQLKTLPLHLGHASQQGDKMIAKHGTWLLDTLLHSIQHLKSAAKTTQLAEQYSPQQQAIQPVKALETLLAKPQTEQTIQQTSQPLQQLERVVEQLSDSVQKENIQTTLKALQQTLRHNKDHDSDSHTNHDPLLLLGKLNKPLSFLRQQEQRQQQKLRQVAVHNSQPKQYVVIQQRHHSERLDQLAYQYYTDPSLWRELAYANAIINPLKLATNTRLKVPPYKEIR